MVAAGFARNLVLLNPLNS